MTILNLLQKKVPNNQNKDNFIDKAFTVIAESIVKIMPIADKEKKASSFNDKLNNLNIYYLIIIPG